MIKGPVIASFNPIIVRFKLQTLAEYNLMIKPFNPIIVRFKLVESDNTPVPIPSFQSYNSSIQTSNTDMDQRVTVLFQSYNSSIQTPFYIDKSNYYSTFNPIIVRFKRIRLAAAVLLLIAFNPIIVRFKPPQRLLFSCISSGDYLKEKLVSL